MIQSSLQRKRDPRLDLLKWLALFFMVIDHLRYVSPVFSWCYIPGRLAFPFFSLVVAAHLYFLFQQPTQRQPLLRYLLWMLGFAVISEWPYELFIPKARSLNVFVTLSLGVLVVAGYLKDKMMGVLLGILVLGVSFWFQRQVMYGVAGVLLPGAFILAFRYGALTWILPAILSLLVNLRYVSPESIVQLKLYPISALLASLLAVFIGKKILEMAIPQHVWPVKKWAYAFYPAHLLILYSLRDFV